ncbi:MAG TPA: neutral/alkaline non-lysosomal ceramidase N-terminal domain-containing protein [Bryobacteraceae bacterium]|nr:neutral/alkaline non-lysosomal ceramidase N-terminal domain-containing protein [Bryobacteraceae bacterium]
MRWPLLLFAVPWLTCAADFRVGRAAVVVTPPVGTPMGGSYSLRVSTGVHDDLYAKALVIESNGSRAALVACDMVSVAPAVIEEARRLITERTGIPGARVMISGTHSHTGPIMPTGDPRDAAFGGTQEITQKYIQGLPLKIASSVEQAVARLESARISRGAGQEDSLGFNRRFFMKDGTVGWNPGKLNPNIVRPAGPVDPTVSVVYCESLAGAPLATYVNYAVHLDTTGGLEFSADYPYTLASTLEKIKGSGMLTLFTIGAAGNVNHINVKNGTKQSGFAEAARIGTVLAGEVLKTYTRLTPVQAGDVTARSESVPLAPAPLQPGDVDKAKAIVARLNTAGKPTFLETVFALKVLGASARDGRPYDAEVQVIALGDQIAWVGLPGEIFSELGMAIRKASPFPQTIVVELAHGPVTYFPDERAFPQGNYEVVSSRAAPGSGEKMVNAAVRLLNDLYTKKNGAKEDK